MHKINAKGYLISDEIDPRFRPGVIVRGNKWARYNTTTTGTQWVIVEIDIENLYDEDAAHMLGNMMISDNIESPAFTVQAACFDFVSDPNIKTNRDAIHLLRR